MFRRYLCLVEFFDLMHDEIIIVIVVSQKLYLYPNDILHEILENIVHNVQDVIAFEMQCLYEYREYDELVRHLM